MYETDTTRQEQEYMETSHTLDVNSDRARASVSLIDMSMGKECTMALVPPFRIRNESGRLQKLCTRRLIKSGVAAACSAPEERME